MQAAMIDSHCHLTYPQLASQLQAVLQRAAAAGVSRMITVGTSIDDARRAIALCRAHENIRCCVGIHPHHADEASDADIAALCDLLQEACVLAMGEMGLDYHYEFSSRARQKDVFAAQLQIARNARRPIVIHCREAFDDCFAILNGSEIPAVFHCFTGSGDEARRVLDAGYLIGLTGVVTFKKSDELRKLARRIPIDRLLLETDAPYLSPEPMRKQKVNEPALIIHTAAAIAQIKGISFQDVEQTTAQNTHRFFNWPQ